MKRINKNDYLCKYRVLYNGYPILNEVHISCQPFDNPISLYDEHDFYYDDYYGRFYEGSFLNKVNALYGDCSFRYDHGANIFLPIVDRLRVPNRLIPIYCANSCKEILDAVQQMEKYSPDYKFLYRGQNQIYLLSRTTEEKVQLYGNSNIKEPSFLPSFQRKNLDYNKTVNAWHNVCALLIDELPKTNSDLLYIRLAEDFHLLALGLAQHYGLPSIGLDLTNDLKVALWFAIYQANYSSTSPVSAELISDSYKDATIFIFRCPKQSIFKYPNIKNSLGAHRPISQKAYFNHCGWGLSKNQLALNLACGFRVNRSFAKELPDNFIRQLFPTVEEDRVLRILLKIKERYKGTELGEMLDSIYL